MEDGFPVTTAGAEAEVGFAVGFGVSFRTGFGEGVSVRLSMGFEAGAACIRSTGLRGKPNGEGCELSVCRVSSVGWEKAVWA